MAEFKPIKGTSVEIAGKAVVEGQFLVETDTGNVYVDIGGGLRLPLLNGKAPRGKVVQIVGDGTQTTWSVGHLFGTENVMVEVVEEATKETVLTGVKRIDNSNVEITFAVAPAVGDSYTVMVVSAA
jgi:hypothetical protein